MLGARADSDAQDSAGDDTATHPQSSTAGGRDRGSGRACAYAAARLQLWLGLGFSFGFDFQLDGSKSIMPLSLRPSTIGGSAIDRR